LKDPATDTIGKDPYITMSYKITMLICQQPNLADRAAVKAFGDLIRKNAAVDWEKDTKGAGALGFDAFFMSMFGKKARGGGHGA